MNHHEETGCQAPPAGPILCINNCGFFGSAATMNMCSKCHKDSMLKQDQANLAASSIGNVVNGKSKEPVVAVNSVDPKPIFMNSIFSFRSEYDVSDPRPSSFTFESGQNNGEGKQLEGPKRCTTCNKRVGLTGFDCRCGHLFCAVHRLSGHKAFLHAFYLPPFDHTNYPSRRDVSNPTHRYSEKHDCSYDYRTAGREAIAKANPVVKAQKLDKI
ncbi:hypothetical protein M0R45_026393 [Rubus argutus]|uniref:Uncharacterized protein n=1 Tax=Rubus argutus TaxID=59490 RepID=A0AAW1WWW3_RUBAR